MITKRVAAVLAISCLVAGGCASTPEPVVITNNTFIAPPKALTTKGSVEPPPNKEVYAKASWGLKETLLINMNTRQLRNLQACYRNLDSITDWALQNKAAYDAPGEDDAHRTNP